MKKVLNVFVMLVVVAACILPAIKAQSAPGPNLVSNPSVEAPKPANTNLPLDWQKEAWGTNTNKFTYVNNDAHTGTRSVRADLTKYTNGDAKWFFKAVAVQANKSYTFTDYYKANVATSVVAEVQDAAGNLSYYELGTPAINSTTWQSYTATFTTPATAKKVTILHLIKKVGWLQIDDAYFGLSGTNPPTPPSVNLTAPTANATVSGTRAVSANASDADGLAGVQFKVDGVNIGAEDTSAPYSVNWDTTATTNAAHTLTAVARNTTALTTVSSPIQVTVNNVVTPQPPQNITPNQSMETPDPANAQKPLGWVSNKWGTNTTIFTYAQDGQDGGRSLKTQITAYTDGDAKWYADPSTVEVNQHYTYKDYYKATIETKIFVAFIDAGGNWTFQWLRNVPASATWQQVSTGFTTPANATKVTIFHLIDGVGTLQIDNVNLQKAPLPLNVGPVPNSSLEVTSDNTPDTPANWLSNSWGTNTAAFTYVNEGHTGNKSIKVTVSNYQDGDAKWWSDPVTSLERSKQYKFSTWYKTNVTPKAVVRFTHDDNSQTFATLPIPQPTGGSDWQLYSDTFTVPATAKAVTPFLFLDTNGWVQTDDYTITPYQAVGFNQPLVTLTFDDGEEVNVANALPPLNQHGFKTTHCYATEHVEGNAQATQGVLAFFNSGHEICSHTVSHPFLTQITQQQLTTELEHSKQFLESITGQPVRNFASPYGDYNATVNSVIDNYYQSHRTVDEGYNSKDNFSIYKLRVQNLKNTTTLAEYQSWLDRAKADKTWLVLVYHRVAPDAGPFDSFPADFAAQLQAIQNSGISVKTYQDALTELQPQL